MTDLSRIIRAQREMAAAATEIERQAARAEAAERERDALRDRLRWIPVEERLFLLSFTIEAIMILYKFYSPTCQPCKVLDKILKEIGLPDGVELVEINVTENPEFTRMSGVKVVPTLFLAGKRLEGLKSKQEVINFLYGD